MNIAIEELKTKLGKKILINEKLSNYSWFNVGGPAEILFKPDSVEDVHYFIKTLKPRKFIVLGAGSNTLIRDGGIKGVAIKLSSSFSFIKLYSKNIIEVGAATLDKKVANFAMENSLTGLEFLACIPGSIGGAIRMNTGCYGSDVSKILHSIKVINNKGEIKEILAKDIKFFYRGTNLTGNFIIISVKLIGEHYLKKKILKKKKKKIKKKKINRNSKKIFFT